MELEKMIGTIFSNVKYPKEVQERLELELKRKHFKHVCTSCGKNIKKKDLINKRYWFDLKLYLYDCNYCGTSMTLDIDL